MITMFYTSVFFSKLTKTISYPSLKLPFQLFPINYFITESTTTRIQVISPFQTPQTANSKGR